MVKKTIPSIRELADVPDNELKEAMIDFCNRLHIHGSGDGYNLYEAILHEKKKNQPQTYDEQLKRAG